jgi:hypothetical protein
VEEEEEVFEEELDEEEEEYEEEPRPKKKKSKPESSARRPSAPPSRRRPTYDDDYEDDYYEPRRRPPSRGERGPPSRGGRHGRMVPYTNQGAATFTRGLQALRENLPDPNTLKDAAFSSISAARQTTSRLSANIYREVKGLTSSELEQVMLKATRPDDTAVKGKHVERLVGVTYQISGRYDIYDAVLRKLWAKMTEKDWRTTIKAIYILHRFSADGAPEHQAALKARLRELRRTRDPKRKDKYFNSKQLLAGDATVSIVLMFVDSNSLPTYALTPFLLQPENMKFRAFMSRYAHYVLLRAQCFGGMFDEIATEPKVLSTKKAAKPITSTCLRTEHLEAAKMVLKAGMACMLKDGEECENTAICVERVASDMIGVSTAVASALNRALKADGLKGADVGLIKQWCEFYSEDLLPQSKSMVKKTSPKLDAFGLFLPSRMGATVSQELLQKGLSLVADESSTSISPQEEDESIREEQAIVEEAVEQEEEIDEEAAVEGEQDEVADEAVDEPPEDEDEEWDYEEEYYDDEEE